MATFKVLLDKRRQLQDKTYPLVVRIYTGRTFKDINLKTYLHENQFDTIKHKVKKNHPNEKMINMRIKQAVLQVQDTKLNLEIRDEVLSAEKIKNNVVKPQPKLNFIQYADGLILQMRQVNRNGNASAYRDAINALKEYSGRTDLQFKEINYELLSSIENKMLVKGRKKNTIAAYNRSLRAIYNRAINDDLVELKYYPYRKYKIKGEATAKRNISKVDIKAIAEMQLEPDSQLWHSRNYFMLSFNLRGISFADMISIRPTDITDGRLIYKRKKTRKLYNIKLTGKAKEIFSYYYEPTARYVLPVLEAHIEPNSEQERIATHQAVKTCNKYLERIGKKLKLPLKLTTYFSRHSHATIAKKMGYSKDLISESLGHSHGSRITEVYLDSYEPEMIDAMNEKVCQL